VGAGQTRLQRAPTTRQRPDATGGGGVMAPLMALPRVRLTRFLAGTGPSRLSPTSSGTSADLDHDPRRPLAVTRTRS